MPCSNENDVAICIPTKREIQHVNKSAGFTLVVCLEVAVWLIEKKLNITLKQNLLTHLHKRVYLPTRGRCHKFQSK